MSVWISIDDIKTDVLYGLLIGEGYINRATLEKGKKWSLWFYPSDKGRKRGMIYHKRSCQGGDFLTFEIKVIDLLKQARLATIIPKEIHIDNEALKYSSKKYVYRSREE